MPSPFDVLGVDADADDDEVRAAYRERVKDAHPDHGGTKQEFRAVREAYERILDGDVPDETTADDAEPNAGPTNGTGGRGSAGDAGRDGSHTADTDAGRTNGQTDTGTGTGTEARERSTGDGRDDEADGDGIRVEYLDYEALDDMGWDIGDEDLFAKAAAAGLDSEAYGFLTVEPNETLLEAAERAGHSWPFACRGGACTNCAVAVVDGDVTTPRGHILPDEVRADGIRLSCLGRPTVDGTKVIYNVKHLPFLDELVLPANR